MDTELGGCTDREFGECMVRNWVDAWTENWVDARTENWVDAWLDAHAQSSKLGGCMDRELGGCTARCTCPELRIGRMHGQRIGWMHGSMHMPRTQNWVDARTENLVNARLDAHAQNSELNIALEVLGGCFEMIYYVFSYNNQSTLTICCYSHKRTYNSTSKSSQNSLRAPPVQYSSI